MLYSLFPILTMFFVIWFVILKPGKEYLYYKHIIKKNRGEKSLMKELAKQFVGKECIVYTVNGSTVTGTVKAVTDGTLLVEGKDSKEAINLDFVSRLREYPVNKNGRKKSIIAD